jgi:hypothetical protein
MNELCKKDGGVHVFETVVLPSAMFDQHGDPFQGWRSRSVVDWLGPSYSFIRENVYLKKGDPVNGQAELRRLQWKIVRKSDNKVLAEAARYSRSGGDLIQLDHFSSSACPEQLGDADVINAVFIREGKGNAKN